MPIWMVDSPAIQGPPDVDERGGNFGPYRGGVAVPEVVGGLTRDGLAHSVVRGHREDP